MKAKNYFEGWYFKQQNGHEALALIPAFHVDEKGVVSASIQVITEEETFYFTYAPAVCKTTSGLDRTRPCIKIGANIFSDQGVILNIRDQDTQIAGCLKYSPWLGLNYDIMGPFKYVPFMECRHSVFSMTHKVDGKITIQGQTYLFEHGTGYVEGDRGTSFPTKYIWIQSSFSQANLQSIMLSIAKVALSDTVTFGSGGFTGCIGIICYKGKEYRIATYLGARVMHISKKYIIVTQGSLVLHIWPEESGTAHILHSPHHGVMTKYIKESLTAKIRYQCYYKYRLLFDVVSEQAGYENEWESCT